MDKLKLDKRKEIIISSAYFSLIVLSAFLILKYLIPFFIPFIIGFSIAFILKPISRTLCRNSNLGCKFCGTLVVIVTYILIVFLIWFVGSKVIEAIQSFSGSASGIYENYISPIIERFNQIAFNLASTFSPDFADQTTEILKGITDGINQTVSSMSQSIIIWLAKVGMSIPNFFVGLMFAIMSSIFISSDYSNIVSFVAKLFPKNKRRVLFETKVYTVETLIKYLRAYIILMFITFIELIIGLFTVGIENPIGIAAVIALFDTLPLIGSGIILLPWCLISFALGNLGIAIGLLVINIFISVFRGFLEPKILGKQLGLHPLATLLSVYIGMKLFGVLGMIIFPILLQIIACLYKSNKTKFKSELLGKSIQ